MDRFRECIRRYRTGVAAAAVLLVSAASFLPGEIKAQLHMRGPFHAWGHVYAFALVLVALDLGARGTCQRWMAVGGTALLGFVIEFMQARQSWSAVEWADLACDGLGILAAMLILSLERSGMGEVPLQTSAQPPAL